MDISQYMCMDYMGFETTNYNRKCIYEYGFKRHACMVWRCVVLFENWFFSYF